MHRCNESHIADCYTTGESIGANDALMTSEEQQQVCAPPPRPTRRLTGLHGHSLADQQHSSLSSAATDPDLPEETSPGEAHRSQTTV